MKLFEIAQQLTPEQIKWLNSVVDGKWEYENGKVNVEGNVSISYRSLSDFPVKFGYVSKHFSCHDNNKLASLAGAPREVGGFYNCSNNKLASLAGAPREVGGTFYCYGNNLTSLAGGPKEVGGSFHCDDNNLTSLAGAPREVGGNFDCGNNKFKSEPDHSFIKIGGTFLWK